MHKLGLAALCAAGFLTLAGQASAAIMQATVTGTLTGGADTTGIFGKAGADLSGQAYASTYEFDTSLGQFIPLGADAFLGYDQAGGVTPFILFPSPVLNTSVTIAGVTVSIDPVLGGDFGSEGLTGYPTFDVDALAGSNHFRSFVAFPLGVLNNVPTHTFSGSGSGLSTFTYASGDSAFSANGTTAGATITCLQSCPAVPEPTTWAMMLVGFFGLGGVLRRRGVVGAST